jgi:hypothetical protein
MNHYKELSLQLTEAVKQERKGVYSATPEHIATWEKIRKKMAGSSKMQQRVANLIKARYAEANRKRSI